MYLTPIFACKALKHIGGYVSVLQVALSFVYYSSHMLNPNIALTIVVKSRRPFSEMGAASIMNMRLCNNNHPTLLFGLA